MEQRINEKRSRFRPWNWKAPTLILVLIVGRFLQSCQSTISNSIVSWGEPTLIVPDAEGEDGIVSPVAVDELGNAFIVWVRSKGELKSLWTKAYTVKKGWGSETQIGRESTDVLDAQIAMNSFGDGILLWSQFDDGNTRIHASRYEPSVGWGAAIPIQTVPENASSPQVAMDNLGNGIAVWDQSNRSGGSIHAISYRKGKGWDLSKMISTASGYAHGPQIAMDESGNAVVVWFQSEGTDYQIWANRYQTDDGWGTPLRIQELGGDSLHPQGALYGKGSAIVVWRQFDGTNYSL